MSKDEEILKAIAELTTHVTQALERTKANSDWIKFFGLVLICVIGGLIAVAFK